MSKMVTVFIGEGSIDKLHIVGAASNHFIFLILLMIFFSYYSYVEPLKHIQFHARHFATGWSGCTLSPNFPCPNSWRRLQFGRKTTLRSKEKRSRLMVSNLRESFETRQPSRNIWDHPQELIMKMLDIQLLSVGVNFLSNCVWS